MSADQKGATAQLICSGGHFAGSRFELGEDTTLGIDAAGHLVVGPSSKAPSRPMMRVFLVNGTMRIEPLAAASGITLDGSPVTSPSSLDRRHVIGVNGVGEFVYTRVTTSRAPAALQPPPPAPPPPPPPPPAPAPVAPPPPPPQPAQAKPVFDDVRSTRLEKDGFGAVPELKKKTPPPAAPVKAAGTMVGEVTFDPLPNLAKRGTPAAPAAPPPAPVPPRPPAPSSPAVPPAPPAQSDEDRTNIFVPPTLYELHVTIPDVGPSVFPLKLGENVVGRGADADIRIPDPKKWLSRKHVVVKVSVDKVELVDLAGTNGTFVNGQRITNVTIVPGQQFDLGPSLAITLRKK